jgi:hypothetical protein
MAERVKDLQHWEQGARALPGRLGECLERGCGGALVVVESMGQWDWCQCSRCHVQVGVGVAGAAGGAGDARKGDDEPVAPVYTGDAFLDAT